MPQKTYDQLDYKTQQLIDAAIFSSEAARILSKSRHFNDEREVFIGHPKEMVDYLRGLYTMDIQTTQPRYAHWHDGGKGLIDGAIAIQRDAPGITDGVSSLNDLLELLTNLPYPEQGEGAGRGR